MTARDRQRARAFACYFRDALVTRACRDAVRRLGRALTREEHHVIRIAVRSFVPPRRRPVRFVLTSAGRQALGQERAP